MYSLLGRLRSIAQTISYEVVIILLIILELIIIERLNLLNLKIFQEKCIFFFINLLIRIILYIRIIVELNRTPFDLTEGESELISGFNVEYIGGKFALIFIVEYGIIIYFFIFYKILIINGKFEKFIDFFIFIIIILLTIFIRSRIPRIRYDKLIYLI